MPSKFSLWAGNVLYKYCFPIYKITYQSFKEKQDAFEIELIKKNVRQGDCVLDIGANIGFYAEKLSEFVGDKGEVHCFEPDQTNFNHLKNRTCHLKNVFINHKAVSKDSTPLKIYTSKMLNVDHRTYEPDQYDEVIEIQATSIDEYLKGKTVNFIKMDIQGFEMNAVRGMIETLKKSDVRMLSEFWPYGMKKAGSSVLDYFIFLKNLDFHVYLINDGQFELLDEQKVKTFIDLPESTYMNVFATKSHV